MFLIELKSPVVSLGYTRKQIAKLGFWNGYNQFASDSYFRLQKQKVHKHFYSQNVWRWSGLGAKRIDSKRRHCLQCYQPLMH